MEKEKKKIRLSPGQQTAYEVVMSGRNAFIQGGAGTGKSVLISKLAEDLRAEGKSVILCAPTGIAARHISGVTIHSAFGFSAGPAITDGGGRQKPRVMTRAGKPIQTADVIIIDEVSMVRTDYMDAVIASIRKAEKAAGKHIQLVVVGDVRQLPPVCTDMDRPALAAFYGDYGRQRFYPFLANSWNDAQLTPILLTDIMRTGDAEYAYMQYLAAEGDPACCPYFNSRVRALDPADCVQIASWRQVVDRINRKAVLALPGEGVTVKTLTEYQEWYLKKTGQKVGDDVETVKGLPGDLIIKPGMRVIMTQTDHGDAESVSGMLGERHKSREPLYVNGSVGRISSVDGGSGVKDAEVGLDVDGRLLYMPSVEYPIYDLSVTGGKRSPAKLKQAHVGSSWQFPFLPAYAMTVHKSQGQTYDRVCITPDCFDAGQLYVGLSRATSIDGITLTRPMCAGDLRTDPIVTDFLAQMFGDERRIRL